MKLDFSHDNKYVRAGITSFLVIAASLFLYYAMFHGRNLVRGFHTFLSVMAPVIYGCAIAFLLTPVVNFFDRTVAGGVFRAMGKEPSSRTKNTIRTVSVILSLLFFLMIIYALLAMILPELIQTIMSLISNIPSYAQTISAFLQRQIEEGELNTEFGVRFENYYVQFQEYITNNIVPELQKILLELTSGVFDMVIFLKDFLIGALISLYVMGAKEKFVARAKMIIYALFPLNAARFIIRAMRYTGSTFSGFITGKLLDSAIIGLICYVACRLMNMPYTMLVSVVIGATNVIPFFGPFLGAIPSLLLILLVDPLKCLYFLLFILILQQFDGNFLGPRILGNSTGLSSFMVIVAILVGGGFFGLFGMLLGVPAFAVVFNGIDWLTRRTLRSKKLADTQEDYLEIDYLDPDTGQPVLKKEKIRVNRTEYKQSATWRAILMAVKGAGHLFIALVAYLISRRHKMVNMYNEWQDRRKKKKKIAE